MACIRPHTYEDINVLLEFTRSEGWGFSEIDCRATMMVDPEGLLVAEDDTGKPVGFIGCFNMVPDIMYVNLFIVRKDMRGKGIGRKLWNAMLETAGNKIVVLDSVSEMKEWYKKQGLVYEEFTVKGYKGKIANVESDISGDSSYICEPLTNEHLPALLVYDQKIYPYSREKVLRAWYFGSDKYSFVALCDNKIVGYASCHMKSKNECIIRALYADNDIIADKLLVKLLSYIPKGTMIGFVILDDKPLPKYFADFVKTGTEFRLLMKEMPGIQTDKMIINAAHTV
ncbi:uncharacterized protein LOC132721056 isoform X2 [Ruditapes philippinarum]|uniref:uncharacterized protein LOC132721056 isoform X2 n=1 Tax=Ruditapes philippinarum TaxID=129788 RepID=UPI00295AF4DD|nr:uncharacterized protein LOC132721056 isoform X2 [Ruditapes philippinarum]